MQEVGAEVEAAAEVEVAAAVAAEVEVAEVEEEVRFLASSKARVRWSGRRR